MRPTRPAGARRDACAAKLMLRTAHDNIDSQRCYERAGWTLDERFRTYQKYLRA